MGQWKPLPEGMEPAARRLVVRLRELKDQMNLSTTALAAKTAYSRSSWERYLNGRTLPPRQAVEAVSRVSGADLTALLALWELAEHARVQGRREGSAGAAPDAGPQHRAADPAEGRPRPRHRHPAMVSVAVAATLAVLALAVWTALRTTSAPASADRAPGTRVAVRPSGFPCHYTRRSGRLFAGHSTSEPLVLLNAGGEQVVEVQCLLAAHGHSPGRIDGLFGEHTESAVKELQRSGGAAVDGKVGPHTWALLRA
ncbi:peptidoglycan-binding protein [Streptomyces sp. NPDC021562]|uniref:peptidoglycan-binding protein n=1 Tax=Streptomyces sp. NPDC021562 TaxID=3155121 RepID=UPI0033D1BA4C